MLDANPNKNQRDKQSKAFDALKATTTALLTEGKATELLAGLATMALHALKADSTEKDKALGVVLTSTSAVIGHLAACLTDLQTEVAQLKIRIATLEGGENGEA